MLRWGVALLATAILGFVGIWAYVEIGAWQWTPLDTPLDVRAHTVSSAPFAVAGSKPYVVEIEVRQDVPYADCLLGQVNNGFDNHCGGYKRLVDVTWQVLDEHGASIAGGTSGGTCCSYSDHRVSTQLGAFTVDKAQRVSLRLTYNRDASPLEKLGPRLRTNVSWEVSEGAGVVEALWMLLFIVVGAIGIVLLGAYGIRSATARKQRTTS